MLHQILCHGSAYEKNVLNMSVFRYGQSNSITHREVTRRKSKSGAVVKHQSTFVVLKTTSNVKGHFKSGTAPLYCSLVTSLTHQPCMVWGALWGTMDWILKFSHLFNSK